MKNKKQNNLQNTAKSKTKHKILTKQTINPKNYAYEKPFKQKQ